MSVVALAGLSAFCLLRRGMISITDFFRILIALFIILLYEIHGEYGEE